METPARAILAADGLVDQHQVKVQNVAPNAVSGVNRPQDENDA
jgi:hypothetical protein